jgi:hypothetical protein
MLMPLVAGACVDQFTATPEPGTTRYAGVSSAGIDAAQVQCGPFRFDVAVGPERIEGRAFGEGWQPPPATFGLFGEYLPASATAAVTSWWIEGTLPKDDTVQLEIRMQAPYWYGARPYMVWRGARVGDTILLKEAPPSCEREVTLQVQ